MNRERMVKVYNSAVAEELLKFEMREYITPKDDDENLCRTAGCFAGHAYVLKMVEDGYTPEAAVTELECTYVPSIRDIARNYLDLDFNQAEELFVPNNVLRMTKLEALNHFTEFMNKYDRKEV